MLLLSYEWNQLPFQSCVLGYSLQASRSCAIHGYGQRRCDRLMVGRWGHGTLRCWAHGGPSCHEPMEYVSKSHHQLEICWKFLHAQKITPPPLNLYKQTSQQIQRDHQNFRQSTILYISCEPLPQTLNTTPHRRPLLFPFPIAAISSSNRGNLKLGGSLDSPSIGVSDPVFRSFDPREKSNRYAFKSSRCPIYQCTRS